MKGKSRKEAHWQGDHGKGTFFLDLKMAYDFTVRENLWNDLKICDRDLELC